ncbi:hypothetical protein COV24_02045 [candidate division WWE3 bacterium CG10_big_fil_rev_8_21_14_0_10_32_10]|uniref:Uncharacterized protein n=1 Tax=candidate division WWE3 bacterium CG10_big_fil_rev_8_21_14_0_10_32_10 TaxID=1975090 RepID=A0A2H0RC24_UNCKA|nr:MAG: hypothetical protein COV24_02045 [candidate division WWE3 bacterium CG10_big_fil_rev_8_21_14_0_10_32_10]
MKFKKNFKEHNSYLYIILIAIILFGTKLVLNNLLLAENGDTYDFFKVGYFIKHGNWDYTSKRMPLLPIFLSFFNPEYFVNAGRVIINTFYFLSVFVFYKYSNIILKEKVGNTIKEIITSNSFLVTLIFAFNLVIFENSFYILADTPFLFFNILFLYVFRKYESFNKASQDVQDILLALIAGLSFYTRPEGLLLFVAYGTYLLINKKIKQLLKFGILGFILITPYFIRNILIYNKILYSGYLSDEAGFIFNIQTILLRISNFFFGIGGIWLIPVLYVLFAITRKNKGFSIKKYGVDSLNIETLLFVFYSLVLLAWGPYVRLYTIPISLIIIFAFLKIKEINMSTVSKSNWLIASFLVLSSILFYIIVLQKYDQTDLGYRKIGKIMSLLLSFPVIFAFYFFSINKLSKKYFLIVFSILIIIINIVVFTEKFIITRYKYSTLKKATEYYMENYKNNGNLGYDSGSDVETWYTRDFEKKNNYLKSGEDFFKWAKNRNIKYIVTTQEMGHNDKFIDYIKWNELKHKVLKEYQSPFFYGKTKLIEIE